MTNYRHAVLYGSGIAFVMMLGGAATQYAFRLYLARSQPLEVLGLYFSVWSLLNTFFGIRALGTAPAFVRLFTKYKNARDASGMNGTLLAYLGIQCAIVFPIFFSVLSVASLLAVHYFHTTDAIPFLHLIAGGFLFTPFFSTYRAYFMAHHRTGLQSSIELLQNVAVFVFTVVAVYLLNVPNALAIGVLIGYLLVAIWCCISLVNSKSFMFVRPRFDTAISQELLSFGIPITIGNVLSSVLGSIDVFLLTYFVGLDAVGVYAIVAGTVSILRYIPRAVATTVLPVSTELYLQATPNLAMAIQRIWKYLFLFLVPCIVVLIAESHTILTLLYGARFLEGSVVLMILSVGSLFTAYYIINNNILFGLNMPKSFTLITLLGCLFLLIIGYPLVKLLGMTGVAIASALTYCLLGTLSIIFIQNKSKTLFPWTSILMAGIAAVFSFIVVKFVGHWITSVSAPVEFVISSFIICTVYFVILFRMKIAHMKELIGNDFELICSTVRNRLRRIL